MLSEKTWKLEGLVLLVAGILFCISTITLLSAIIQHFAGKGSFAEGSLLYLVFGSLSLHGSILAGTWICLWWQRISWGEAFGFSMPYKGRAMLLGLIAALAFVPVGGFLQALGVKVMTELHFATPPQEAVAEFDKVSSWASRIYLAAFAIILAPFAEEVFFRGIIYTGLKQFSRHGFTCWVAIILVATIFPHTRIFAPLLTLGLLLAWLYESVGRPGLAIWGSASAFAAVHNSPQIFIPLLLLGFVLVWLYEKTNNLLASMTAHAVFNAVNVGLLFFGDRLDQIQHDALHHLQ